MKTLIATTGLTIMFLSAGAFAGNDSSSRPATITITKSENVTVIEKNAAWPLPGRITVDPCAANRCVDI